MATRASRTSADLLDNENGRFRGDLFLVVLLTGLHGLGGLSMVPVMSAIREQFADNPQVDWLVPVALSVYSLSTALFSPLAGQILDRYGRRTLLVGGLVAYAFFGTAPLWVTTLEQLVISRACLGVAAAAVFTSALTLLGDARQGTRYASLIATMAVHVNAAAAVIYALVGVLGERDWRATSWPYVSALVLAVLLAVVLRRHREETIADTRSPQFRSHRSAGPARIAPAAVLTVFATIVFYAPTVGSVVVLQGVGVTSPGTLGLVSGLTLLSTAVGSAIFHGVVATRPTVPLTVAFAFAAIGFLIITVSGGFANDAVAGMVAVAGLVISSVGCGLLLPSITVWSTRDFVYRQRGRGAGVMMGSFYMGGFLLPLALQVLAPRIGGILPLYSLLACLSLVLAGVTGVIARRERPPIGALPGSPLNR